MYSPAAQAISHDSDGLGAALGKSSQLMSDDVCAAADAVCFALDGVGSPLWADCTAYE